jgi:hypothetical protein
MLAQQRAQCRERDMKLSEEKELECGKDGCKQKLMTWVDDTKRNT